MMIVAGCMLGFAAPTHGMSPDDAMSQEEREQLEQALKISAAEAAAEKGKLNPAEQEKADMERALKESAEEARAQEEAREVRRKEAEGIRAGTSRKYTEEAPGPSPFRGGLGAAYRPRTSTTTFTRQPEIREAEEDAEFRAAQKRSVTDRGGSYERQEADRMREREAQEEFERRFLRKEQPTTNQESAAAQN